MRVEFHYLIHSISCLCVITIQWSYNEFAGIAPSSKATNEFIITVKKGKKSSQMTFSSDYRSEILTEALVSKLFLDVYLYIIVVDNWQEHSMTSICSFKL